MRRHEDVLGHDRVAPGAGHPAGVPVVEDGELAAAERQTVGIAPSSSVEAALMHRPLRSVTAGVEAPAPVDRQSRRPSRVAVPVGEKTPLILGSRVAKSSSCASSGKTPASQDMALKIVATHDVDGQPRAISASTSHCVWKSAS